MQFDKDMMAQLLAETISEVLRRIEQPSIVNGVAVFPAANATMVDVVLLDTTTQKTLAVSLVFPDPEKLTGTEQEYEVEDWQKEFPLTTICREDLQECGFTDEQIASLTDEDMHAIASKMADLYLDQGFWEDLQFVTEIRLLEKQKGAE